MSVPFLPFLPFLSLYPGPAAAPLDVPEGVRPLHPPPHPPHPPHPVPEAALPPCPLEGEVIGGGGEHEHVFEGSVSRVQGRCLRFLSLDLPVGLMVPLLSDTALTVHMTITKGRECCRRSVP